LNRLLVAAMLAAYALAGAAPPAAVPAPALAAPNATEADPLGLGGPLAAPPPPPSPSPLVQVSGSPTAVRIPKIGVQSPLENLGADAAGVVVPPKDFARAGWFAGGVAPGDPGPALIAGHVDSRTGPAVFYRLHQLHAGDVVQVQRGGRWLTFRVVTTERYAKDEFPTDKVYRPTPGPELRLITCGGTFNQANRSYRDNIVVYAVAP
jgi:LPXTG-site transpeptidase (sortase) family protein